MTQPCAEVLEAEKDKLFVTDAELIRRLGVPEKIARETLRELDRRAVGFPRKQKKWGDRRYWPAVLAYLDHECGITVADRNRGDGNASNSTRTALAKTQRQVGGDLASAGRSGPTRLPSEKLVTLERPRHDAS